LWKDFTVTLVEGPTGNFGTKVNSKNQEKKFGEQIYLINFEEKN
jgi:hypothetical protein